VGTQDNRGGGKERTQEVIWPATLGWRWGEMKKKRKREKINKVTRNMGTVALDRHDQKFRPSRMTYHKMLGRLIVQEK